MGNCPSVSTVITGPLRAVATRIRELAYQTVEDRPLHALADAMGAPHDGDADWELFQGWDVALLADAMLAHAAALRFWKRYRETADVACSDCPFCDCEFDDDQVGVHALGCPWPHLDYAAQLGDNRPMGERR
jgi:heterodisulfide reductase subunit B